MLFKHPEFLYALFLLIIPIIIHFFQLRKFKIQAFTNVAFLKKVKLQTRKSSKIKKWLVLLSRMLLFAAVIVAFAQPYIPSSQEALKEQERVIYLDNSFSMQQKNAKGVLLKQAIQELLKNIPKEEEFSLLTNNAVFKNVRLNEIKNELLQINYSPKGLNLKTAYLKAAQLFSENPASKKNFIAISDFQKSNLQEEVRFSPQHEVNLLQLSSKEPLNYFIKSAKITTENPSTYTLKVNLQANKKSENTIPVGVYTKNGLFAKTSAGFKETDTASVRFSLPKTEFINAKITIEDKGLAYDNNFHISLPKNQPIKVAVISNDNDTYLQKIFGKKEAFQLDVFSLSKANYSILEKADFIILNELENIPNSLRSLLENHSKENGSLALIPSVKADLSAYNTLLQKLGAGKFTEAGNEALKITDIKFSHPLYEGVFNKEVRNFEYPKVEKHFDYSGYGNTILSYNNQQAFLSNRENIYVFTAAISASNSNFKQSPLIVPTFYNMAKQSLALPKLYYTVNRLNKISIPVNLGQDKVLKIGKEKEDFIPRQQKFNEQVNLELEDFPETDGHYMVKNKEQIIENLSFNYSREESDLKPGDLGKFKNANIQNSIANYFTESIKQTQINALWKWFVIFAIGFLLLEVLLLKFLK
ncbi:BatA domain-containing protein [Haloflavibacter putidus]|uniref:Aerotolerance regulator N-terminal domain-containing protein n=1 Tax=Haloflavibacter putidus TaxID=2576776 RepID=A0A507ZR43_9FLAO|nr:BatA domain-containing protein [Haloflavibacter putidus]TQD39081.1 hypothetical protein FKR84_06705 [Haloflavibacter putidus]